MSKHSGPGFTLVELLVVIAIIALLMAVLLPALNRAREQGKRAVCLHDQKQLASAWLMYADDNGDRIVCGDAEEYGNWETSTMAYACPPAAGSPPHCGEKPWTLADWDTSLTVAQKQDKIKGGALFRYVKEVKAYKCPRAEGRETRSFSVVDGMNCTVIAGPSPGGVGSGAVLIKTRQQLKKTYERMIFVDDGGTEGGTMGGWTVYVSRYGWWDVPSARHGDGTTFSFVDSHSEYHKWAEKSTFDAIKLGVSGNTNPLCPNSKDIRWSSIVAWGSDVAGKGN
jgi:prepilin-type N-terminal cleavage/methylation domain-containing protein